MLQRKLLLSSLWLSVPTLDLIVTNLFISGQWFALCQWIKQNSFHWLVWILDHTNWDQCVNCDNNSEFWGIEILPRAWYTPNTIHLKKIFTSSVASSLTHLWPFPTNLHAGWGGGRRSGVQLCLIHTPPMRNTRGKNAKEAEAEEDSSRWRSMNE